MLARNHFQWRRRHFWAWYNSKLRENIPCVDGKKCSTHFTYPLFSLIDLSEFHYHFSNLGRYLLIWSTLDYNSHHNKNDASRKVTIYKRVSLFPSMNYWKSFTRQIKNKPFAKGLLICDKSCLFNSFFIKWKETTFYQLSLPYRKISHLSKVIWNTSSFGLLPCIINVEPIPKVGIVLKYSSFEVFDSNRSPLIMYLLPKLQSVVKSITLVY